MPSAATRRALGRGLADLIPVGGNVSRGTAATAAAPENNPDNAASSSIQDAPIASLHPNPRQPRARFDEAALTELSDSIRANGILQPILVRPRPQSGFEIVAGERRYRAALKAGLKHVPIIVRDLSDEETLALALIENLIREDLGPLETARAFQRLMDDFGWTQEEMGRRVGKSRTVITNSVRLLELPEPIQHSLDKGEISEGHARALIGDKQSRTDPQFQKRQLRAWQEIVSRNLTVRDAERLIKPEADGLRGAAAPRSRSATNSTQAGESAANLKALEDRIRTALGTQVRLVGSEGRGRIEIEYFSGDELDGLLSRLEGTTEEPISSTASASPKRGSGPIQGLLSPRRPTR